MLTATTQWSPRYLALVTLVVAAVLSAPPPPAAAADAGATYGSPALAAQSLPSRGQPRPGPAILHWPLARSPQLENARPWRSAPILISGTSAYRRGEFLYQDFLYDDRGAGSSYTYPTDPRYGGNAADFVEVRITPVSGAMAIRITYNTMLDPELVATTIALGDSSQPRDMPHGANTAAPAEVFVTVHGGTAEAVDAASGAALTAPGIRVKLDERRRQVEIRVPEAVFATAGRSDVRVAAATGLWDAANDQYLVPQETADESQAGGGDGSSSAFFNVAFRYTEPFDRYGWPMVNEGEDWRDAQQAQALSDGDISDFFAVVDFVKLAAKTDDELTGQVGGVPQTGTMSRILVSHFEDAQGRGSNTTGAPPEGDEPLQYAGRLQPYRIYVPSKPAPEDGYPLTLALHGCGVNYNHHAGRPWDEQFGERGVGSIVVMPEGRGDCFWYFGQAGADTFEMWADVAHRYRLNPDEVLITGMSMGGYGTIKHAAQYPDLFRAAIPLIPCPSAGTVWAPGGAAPGGEHTAIRNLAPALRHVPQQIWVGSGDTICTYTFQREFGDRLAELGHQYELLSFPDSHGVTMFTPTEQWLVDWQQEPPALDRDPARVTYVVNHAMIQREVGLDADHAYWLSGMNVRDADASPPVGTIDVFSHGFGRGDAPPSGKQYGAGAAVGNGAIPYELEYQTQGEAAQAPSSNRIDITAVNVASVSIDVQRARVGCDVDLRIDSDGPLDVTLLGCEPDPCAGLSPPVYGDRPDVPAVHRPNVDCVIARRISVGVPAVGLPRFGPAASVTRGQMASFLVNTLVAAGAGDRLPASGHRFADLASSPHAGNVERLAKAGIVHGRSSRRFAPAAPVTRAQMASFVVATAEFATQRALPRGGKAFSDTGRTNVHGEAIEAAYAAGLLTGTTAPRPGRERSGTFSPDDPVQRAQMASFLVRLLEHALSGEVTS